MKYSIALRKHPMLRIGLVFNLIGLRNSMSLSLHILTFVSHVAVVVVGSAHARVF